MQKTILGISGSPRKGGNSEILLAVALEPFAEVGWNIETVFMSGTRICMCTGCEYCVDTSACHIIDDMSKLYTNFEKCDAIIISSPSYWRNIPAQLKAVFDRTFAVSGRKLLAGKLGGAIAVGRATAGGGQSKVLDVIHNWYLSNGMLCVPGELNGVTASADKPGDIFAQSRRLEQARVLGRNIINYAK